MSYVLGIDVGGTFTDFLEVDASGSVEIVEVPTTPQRPADAVLAGLGSRRDLLKGSLTFSAVTAIGGILTGCSRSSPSSNLTAGQSSATRPRHIRSTLCCMEVFLFSLTRQPVLRRSRYVPHRWVVRFLLYIVRHCWIKTPTWCQVGHRVRRTRLIFRLPRHRSSRSVGEMGDICLQLQRPGHCLALARCKAHGNRRI
jgi:hypothetical protein